jgi:predicted protein tyrosine phosphatase
MDIIYRGRLQTMEMLADPGTSPGIGAVVSMTDPQTPPLEISSGAREDLVVHRMPFNDVPTDRPVWIEGLGWAEPPRREHIEELLEVAPRLFGVEGQIVCHCEAGISRSSAVTYILGCVHAGPGHEAEVLETLPDKGLLFPRPNRRLIMLAQEILGDEYRLLEAVDEWAAAQS